MAKDEENQDTSKDNASNDTQPIPLEKVEHDSPMDFSYSKKWTMTVFLSLMTFTTTLCSSIFSSTITVTSKEFNTSETVMLLGVAFFVLGFALGPLLWGPLSELVGRKKPLFGGFIGFALLQIPTALSPTLAGVLICRFLAGCFGAAPVGLISAIYADFWDPVHRGIATALYSTAAYAGPTLGPVVGSFITESHLGWRWTAWIILILAAAVGIPAFFIVPETYAPILKYRTAKEHGIVVDEHTAFSGFVNKYLSRPAKMIIYEPVLIIMTIYIAIVYSILYLTFYAFPYSFSQERGWSRTIGSLPFLSMFTGIVVACCSVALYSFKYYQPRLKERGHILPEDRLPPIMIGSLLLPIGLFWFAWTSSRSIIWVPQVLSGFFIGAGVMLIFTNGVQYIVDIYLTASASALAVNTFIRSAVAAGLPLAGPQMYQTLGTAWATSLLGFLCVALIPAPFLFYKYGSALRARSRFAPNKR